MACTRSTASPEGTPPNPPFARGGKERRLAGSSSPPCEGGVRGGGFASPEVCAIQTLTALIHRLGLLPGAVVACAKGQHAADEQSQRHRHQPAREAVRGGLHLAD